MENIKKMQIVLVMCLCFVIFLFTMMFSFHTNQLVASNSIRKIESCRLTFSDLFIATVGESTYTEPNINGNSFNQFQVRLNKSGDKVIFRFKINNEGAAPCQIKRIKQSIHCNNAKNREDKVICDSLRFLLQYENGSPISVGDTIGGDSSYYAKLVMEYPSNIMSELPIDIRGDTIKIYY